MLCLCENLVGLEKRCLPDRYVFLYHLEVASLEDENVRSGKLAVVGKVHGR